jgi:hypothetical protein
MIETPLAPVFGPGDAVHVLKVRLVSQRYGHGDPAINGSVSARIERIGAAGEQPVVKDLAPSAVGDGHDLDLADLPNGEYRVTLSGTSSEMPVEDAVIHLAILPWSLGAPEWVTCWVGEPVTITPHLIGDLGSAERVVHALVKPLKTVDVVSKKTGDDGSLTITYSRTGPEPACAVASQEGVFVHPMREFMVNVVDRGVYEGEDLVETAKTSGGSCEVDRVEVHNPPVARYFSNGRQLLFVPSAPGDWVEVTIDVPDDADYAIRGVFCGGDSQGIFTVSVDGGAPGEPLDSYGASYMVTDKIELAKAHLTKGPHKLRFTVTDKNPDSQGYALGLDRLIVQ